MTIAGEIKDLTASQAKLARYLGLSKPRINQLINEGVVVRDVNGKEIMIADSIRNYYLNNPSAATGQANTETSYWDEKRLHEKAKRELAELKLAKARGQVYDAKVVEKTLIELVANFRTNLNGAFQRLAPLIVGRDVDEVAQILQSEIEYILDDISKFSVDAFKLEDDDQ